MGNDLKRQILVHNGIISDNEMQKKPAVLTCPRCTLVNAIETKYCSKCSYPLVPAAFEEIKEIAPFDKNKQKWRWWEVVKVLWILSIICNPLCNILYKWSNYYSDRKANCECGQKYARPYLEEIRHDSYIYQFLYLSQQQLKR